MERGIRKSSALVTTAAPATALNLFSRTDNLIGGRVAPRTVIPRKIVAYNGVGATTLMVGTGTGATWVQRLPTLRLVNNMDNVWLPREIPEVEIGDDLTCQTDVAGVEVMVEVEEIG